MPIGTREEIWAAALELCADATHQIASFRSKLADHTRLLFYFFDDLCRWDQRPGANSPSFRYIELAPLLHGLAPAGHEVQVLSICPPPPQSIVFPDLSLEESPDAREGISNAEATGGEELSRSQTLITRELEWEESLAQAQGSSDPLSEPSRGL